MARVCALKRILQVLVHGFCKRVRSCSHALCQGVQGKAVKPIKLLCLYLCYLQLHALHFLCLLGQLHIKE